MSSRATAAPSTAARSDAPRSRRARVRPPSARALEREQEIYNAAAEIFHRKGYAATTLQDIADEVGLLKGSLYYYIDSKEDLLYKITQVIHGGALANLQASAQVPGPASERLRALVEMHVQAFGLMLTWIKVFYTEHASLSGERRRQIMAERREYEEYVYELLRAGQADGSFCPDVDPRIMGSAILTLVNSVYQWYRPGRDEPIEMVAKRYGDFVLAGLRCGPDHHHPRPTSRRRKAGAGAG